MIRYRHKGEKLLKLITNINLLFKSSLKREEKLLLKKAINSESTNYKITTYVECKMFVTIEYKLNYRIDYLYKIGKSTSNEYENIKLQRTCISDLIKDYAMKA